MATCTSATWEARRGGEGSPAPGKSEAGFGRGLPLRQPASRVSPRAAAARPRQCRTCRAITPPPLEGPAPRPLPNPRPGRPGQGDAPNAGNGVPIAPAPAPAPAGPTVGPPPPPPPAPRERV